jgi:hypothetical protein
MCGMKRIAPIIVLACAAVAAQGPASVKGHFSEVNTGEFDLVDGIAYPQGDRTVVYVTSKPIASAQLTSSPCPATLARALVAVRDAGWVEVTLDKRGQSDYFGAGKPYGGSSREKEVGGNYWSSTLKLAGGRAAGQVKHKERGSFEFDLPLLAEKMTEVSENDRMNGRPADASSPTPAEQALTAAYRAAHAAAVKKDWAALLTAVGFDAALVAAIRTMPEIDAELELFADRFLRPGEDIEVEPRQGHGTVRAEGANSKGAKFVNYYWFAPCQGKLVLYSVTENPQ